MVQRTLVGGTPAAEAGNGPGRVNGAPAGAKWRRLRQPFGVSRWLALNPPLAIAD